MGKSDAPLPSRPGTFSHPAGAFVLRAVNISVWPKCAALSFLALAFPLADAAMAQQMPKVESGLLECRGASAIGYGFGSTRKVSCEYRATAGVNQYYTGTLERGGLDFGVSDVGSMLWMVLATTPQLGPGALAGKYVGLSTGFAIGPGFSANVLVGKDVAQGVALQPVSISSDSGLSIYIAGATLTLVTATARDH